MRGRTLRLYFGLLVILIAGGTSLAKAQTVLLFCTWDTSSIFKDKAGKEIFERRFYVSSLVSMSKEAFLEVDADGERIEGLCSDYLDRTVISAAVDRGERLDMGGQLKVIRNIELSGEDVGSKNTYKFGTKEQIEKRRDDMTREMKEAGRYILDFNWDVTGKSEIADLENEKKRTVPTVVK